MPRLPHLRMHRPRQCCIIWLDKRVEALTQDGRPVGLALALDLGRRGVRSTLVERDAGTGTQFLARADYLNERSMEFCQLLGLRDEVVNAGVPEDVLRDTVFCTALNGHFIGRLPLPSVRERTLPPQCREMQRRYPQFWFDPMLARAVARQGMTDVRYGVEFVDCNQDATCVNCFLQGKYLSFAMEVRARYLVACDGLSSKVRKAIGIKTYGIQLGYSVSVIVRVDHLEVYHPLGMGERYMFIRMVAWLFEDLPNSIMREHLDYATNLFVKANGTVLLDTHGWGIFCMTSLLARPCIKESAMA